MTQPWAPLEQSVSLTPAERRGLLTPGRRDILALLGLQPHHWEGPLGCGGVSGLRAPLSEHAQAPTLCKVRDEAWGRCLGPAQCLSAAPSYYGRWRGCEEEIPPPPTPSLLPGAALVRTLPLWMGAPGVPAHGRS